MRAMDINWERNYENWINFNSCHSRNMKTQRNVSTSCSEDSPTFIIAFIRFSSFFIFYAFANNFSPAIFFLRASQKSSSNTIQKVLPLINNKFPFSVDELEMFDKLSCFLRIRRDSCFVVGLNSVNLSFFVRWNNSRRVFRFCACRLSSISATSNDSISVRLPLL